MIFVYLHIIWFTVWIVVNVTGLAFDPFPFGLLTLEAVAGKVGIDVGKVHAMARARIDQGKAQQNQASGASPA
jgi:hypothetical protein